MNQTFIHILTVRFNHRYFHNNSFKTIQISYDEQTNHALKNHEIIIKTFPGGFYLLTADSELLKSDNDSNPLRFRFNSTDSQFINYSDLPQYDLRNNILYFNNLNAKEEEQNKLVLHQNKYVSANDIVAISNQTIQIDKDTETASIKDAKGNILTPSKINKSPLRTSFQFENFGEGIISFESPDNQTRKIYYSSDTVWRKPLGILEIFTNKLYEHVKTDGKIDYTIQFNYRSTIWRYFLIVPDNLKFNNLSIINKKKERAFSGPLKQTIHEDTEAMMFESNNKLPISELQNDTFQLVDNQEPTQPGKVVMKKLPSASSEQISIEPGQATDIQYSNIFLYI